MTKKQLLIVCIVVAIIIGGVVATILMTGNNKEDTADTAANKKADTTTIEPAPEQHDDHLDEIGVDHEDPTSPPLIINNKDTTSADVWRDYIPLAEAAAKEYVFQRTDESIEARQARLKQVFNSTSPAITAAPPKVNVSTYTDITANPVVVNTGWELVRNEVVVTVSLRVISRNNKAPYEDVSNIYQAYDVAFATHSGSYRPQAISFSDKPVIVRKS